MKFRVTDTEIVQDILDTILTEIGVFSSHKVTAVHFFSATRRIVGSTGPTALLNHVGDRNLASTSAERIKSRREGESILLCGVTPRT